MTTNDAKMLAVLAYKFTNKTETLATEALGYNLSQSPQAAVARGALQAVMEGGGVNIGQIARVSTEVPIKVKGKEARVDLIGFGEGNSKRALIEVKFWAGLTENQPNVYLQELLKNANHEPSALLFVAPVLRQETLWPELLRLAGAGGFSLTNVTSAAGVRSAAVNDGPHRLMLTSWLYLLEKLSAATGDPEKEIRQLQGLCAQQDKAAFLPLRAGEIGPDFSKRALDIYYLFRAAINRVHTAGIADGKGLGVSRLEANYGRFTRLGDHDVVGDVWIGIHYGFGTLHRETPFWVMLGYASNAKIDEIRKRLSERGDGLDYIDTEYAKWPVSLVPIHLPAGVEYDHVLDSVVDQIRNIGDILAAPAPGAAL